MYLNIHFRGAFEKQCKIVITSENKMQRNDCSKSKAVLELAQILAMVFLLARNMLIKHYFVKESYQIRHIH